MKTFRKPACTFLVSLLLIVMMTVSLAAPEADVLLSAGELDLAIGESIKITYEVVNSKEVGNPVKTQWESSDGGIATVSGVKVTAVSAGDTVVACTMTFKNDVTYRGEVVVRVYVPLKQLSFEESELSFTVDTQRRLSALQEPEDATYSALTWESADTSIVTVDETGLLTAHKAGTTQVTATANEPIQGESVQKAATATVTVLQPVTEICADNDEACVGIGKKSILPVTLLPEDASNKTLLWTSSDESIVTVLDGEIKGEAEGKATVLCQAADQGGASRNFEVTVFVPATELTLNNKTVTLNTGDTSEPLTYDIVPENAAYKAASWLSDDESIATVDENGVVHAWKAGKTTIHAISPEPIAHDATPKTDKPPIAVLQPVTQIVTPSDNVAVGLTKKMPIPVNVLPEDASDKTLLWSSDDESIATVSPSGTVTGKAIGSTTIRCEAVDGSQSNAAWTVTVYQPVSALSAAEKALTVLVGGETLQAQVIASPEDAAYPSVSWTSSDESIVIVDANGMVTGLQAGTATLTATSAEPIAEADEAKKTKINVTVLQPVEAILPDTPSVELGKGRSMKLDYTLLPEDASSKKVSWQSSDPSVIAVESGRITAKDIGSAAVTCTAEDGSGVTAQWEVLGYTPTTGVSLDTKELTLNVTESSEPIGFSTQPEDALYTGVTWQSADESIAMVDELGVITGVKAGKTTITATSMEPPSGEKKPASASLSVTILQPAEKVMITNAGTRPNRIAKGKTLTLKGIALPEDVSNPKLAWASADESIATVSATGVVTGKTVGTTTITCTTTDGTELSATCEVEVYIPVTAIKVEEKSYASTLGVKRVIAYTVLPKDATYKAINWSSSAYIAETNGYIVAGNVGSIHINPKRAGTTKITGTATDGSGVSVSFDFTTEPKNAVKVTAIRTKRKHNGAKDCLMIEAESNQKKRTIKEFNLTVQLLGQDGDVWDTVRLWNDKPSIGPGKTMSIDNGYYWDNIDYITTAYGVYITVTSVTFTDGAVETISESDQVTTYFYPNMSQY